MYLYTGVCKHCGQQVALTLPAETEDEANQSAIMLCDCYKAKDEQQTVKQIKDAKIRIDELFGEKAKELQFEPVQDKETINLIYLTVEQTARRRLYSTTLLIRDYGKAKISITGKGRIKVERSEVHAYQLEE